jgi:hypothetical protein
MTLIRFIGAALIPVGLCISLVCIVVWLIGRYATQKAVPTVIIAIVVSGLVPLICSGIISLIPDDSPAETFLFPLFIIWWAVSFPGAVALPARSDATFVFIEAFWIVVGALAAVFIVSLRRRAQQQATRNA